MTVETTVESSISSSPKETARAGVAPPPGIWKTLGLTAIAVGILTGEAEVLWSYLLPALNDAWRAVLPQSILGLLGFLGAAVATDVLMVLGAAVVLGVAISIPRIAFRSARTYPNWRWVIHATLVSGALIFLYAGWTCLFILLPEDRGTWTYRGIVGVGSLIAFLIGFFYSKRPFWRRIIRTAMVSGALIFICTAWMGLFILPRANFGTWTYRAIMIAEAVVALLVGLVVSRRLQGLLKRSPRREAVGWWAVALVMLLLTTLPLFARRRWAENKTPVISKSEFALNQNVLLVTIDTVRHDYLGCCGNPWIATPTLDALAAEGALFENAISQAPTTGPSHCSIMTSLYPGAHEGLNGKPMKEGLVAISDILRANGYETAAFVSATTTRSISSGLQQGFDHYADSLVAWSEVFSRDEFQNLMLFYLVGWAQNSQIRGDVVSDRAIRWFDQRAGKRPFFVWLHYFDPHAPYDPPSPYREMYHDKIDDGKPMAAERELYSGEITFADFQLGRVINRLKERNLYDGTLVVVCSDHGEAFGEKHWNFPPETGHGTYLYDTTQRVPLIFKAPAGRALPSRVVEQVQLIDVAPTIMRMLNIASPEAFAGKPLDELIDGRTYSYPLRPAYSSNIVYYSDPGGVDAEPRFVDQLAVRSPEWKYITLPEYNLFELYNLVQDPAEIDNVAQRHPRIRKSNHELVMDVLGRDADTSFDPRRRLAPSVVRQLQSLGYLGGNQPHDGGGKE